MSKHRHALSDKLVWAAMVLESWAALKGIVPEEKILEVFREKSKHKKKVAMADTVAGATAVFINVDQDE